jgi:excinuclease UvrABC nuclease subunit
VGGKNPVGAMVVFENGEADPSQYRLFNIKGNIGSRQQVVDSKQQGEKPFHNFAKLRNEKADLATASSTPYNPLPTTSQDDLAMLEEVLERRLHHSEWPLPQIVFVDGGANQVKRVNSVLKKHGHILPVVGLSKAGQHSASSAGGDKFVVANAGKAGKELIIASRNLFQQVRNESHRFAINAQRKRGKRIFLRS